MVVTLIELDNILLFALEKWESLIHCPRGFELSIDISSTVSQVPYVHQRQLIYRISLVFWATELDTSLSSSICQPASICRYRARGLSPFRGEKVEMVIELGDLSSPVLQEKKEREKMEIKAIITTWSTKSKTPSRSQFVTDKKHCVAGRLMLFWRRVF